MTETKASDLPADVAVEAGENGHTMRPAAGAYDATHDCAACGARAYPTPNLRGQWMGWAIEFTCDEVRALKAES